MGKAARDGEAIGISTRPIRRGRCYGTGGGEIVSIVAVTNRTMDLSMRKPRPRNCSQRKPNDLSRSLATFDMDRTLIAVIEMSASRWLVAGIVPGVERQPLKKLKTDENALLTLLNRWRDEAVRSGHKISRIAVAFEAGRDGFWLARWLNALACDLRARLRSIFPAIPSKRRSALMAFSCGVSNQK